MAYHVRQTHGLLQHKDISCGLDLATVRWGLMSRSKQTALTVLGAGKGPTVSRELSVGRFCLVFRQPKPSLKIGVCS